MEDSNFEGRHKHARECVCEFHGLARCTGLAALILLTHVSMVSWQAAWPHYILGSWQAFAWRCLIVICVTSLLGVFSSFILQEASLGSFSSMMVLGYQYNKGKLQDASVSHSFLCCGMLAKVLLARGSHSDNSDPGGEELDFSSWKGRFMTTLSFPM